jgi:hypothetical protein
MDLTTVKILESTYEIKIDARQWCIDNLGIEAYRYNDLSDNQPWYYNIRNGVAVFIFYNADDAFQFNLVWG